MSGWSVHLAGQPSRESITDTTYAIWFENKQGTRISFSKLCPKGEAAQPATVVPWQLCWDPGSCNPRPSHSFHENQQADERSQSPPPHSWPVLYCGWHVRDCSRAWGTAGSQKADSGGVTSHLPVAVPESVELSLTVRAMPYDNGDI